ISSQTADLLDFEDSTGKVLSGFTASGSLQGGNASGSNVAGSNLVLSGGQGTGTANGGNINFQVADPGTSGSTLNSLATVASLSGANGAATFQNSADSSAAFQIQTAGGTALLNVDTSDSQATVNGNLTVFGGASVNGSGVNGGSGSGSSGDDGGGGGGAIGGVNAVVNPISPNYGANGAQSVDVSGLFSVLSGLSIATVSPGAGNDDTSPACTKPGGNATGFGTGGGGAGYFGGNGGNGLYGGGGG